MSDDWMLKLSSGCLDTELKTLHASSFLWERWGVISNGCKVSFGDDEGILKSDYGDGCTTL